MQKLAKAAEFGDSDDEDFNFSEFEKTTKNGNIMPTMKKSDSCINRTKENIKNLIGSFFKQKFIKRVSYQH
jgi:hypothetical protein